MPVIRYTMRLSGLAAVCFASVAAAQTPSLYASRLEAPRFELGAGYSYVHANAPAGGCGCFSMQGGNASGAFHPSPAFALTASFQATQASHILNSTEDLTLYTYLVGARFTPRRLEMRHIGPFAEGMAGAAHTTSKYPYNDGGSGVALLFGGGLDVPLSRHIAFRAVDVDYLYTHIPNGSNNSQNNIQVTSGIVFRLR